MGKLVEALTDPARRHRVVEGGVRLVEEEVDKKGGLSGLALKAAYKAVTMVRAGFVPHALDRLVPDFAARLEPFWEAREREAPGEPMERFLAERAGAVADALLEITDARIRAADKGPVTSAYEKLRPAARRNVEEAVPGIGRLLDRHAG